eukprot:10487808-Prorocentrum_lima.AAC.1
MCPAAAAVVRGQRGDGVLLADRRRGRGLWVATRGTKRWCQRSGAGRRSSAGGREWEGGECWRGMESPSR